MLPTQHTKLALHTFQQMRSIPSRRREEAWLATTKIENFDFKNLGG